jgi:general secretion pathway protein M
MKEFWNRLTRSQQYYLMGGAAFVAVFLVFQLMIFPFRDERQRTLHSIRVNEKALKEMAVLGLEYSVLKDRAAAVQRVLASRPQDFTLFSYLEKKAGESQLKANIKYINPQKGSVSGAYEESSVEMKLDAMTMKQLTDFLYRTESPKDFINIRKIAITKMKENPGYLTATIQVTTFQSVKTGSR